MEKVITVTQLTNLIEESFELRRNYEKLKRESDVAYAKFQEISRKAASWLENMDIDKLQTPSGTFSYGYDESYRVPKTPEQKELFFDYLKAKGIYEQMVSVNSQTLNSFAKAEEKAALEDGVLDFQIPGLEKGKPTLKPIMRKK